MAKKKEGISKKEREQFAAAIKRLGELIKKLKKEVS